MSTNSVLAGISTLYLLFGKVSQGKQAISLRRGLRVEGHIWNIFNHQMQLFVNGLRTQEMHLMILRNSPGPALRRYYFEISSSRLVRVRGSLTQKSCENMKLERVRLDSKSHNEYITCGKYVMNIPRLLCIPIGALVHAQLYLYDAPSALRYAQNAQPNDSSSVGSFYQMS